YYYSDLHHSNGFFDFAPKSINAINLTNHQITIPVLLSLGLVEGSHQYVLQFGLYGAFVFGLKEKFQDSSGVEKVVEIKDGYNSLNVGIEMSVGLDRLYRKIEIIEPFSGMYIGVRNSFLGISQNRNLCRPVEIFMR